MKYSCFYEKFPIRKGKILVFWYISTGNLVSPIDESLLFVGRKVSSDRQKSAPAGGKVETVGETIPPTGGMVETVDEGLPPTGGKIVLPVYTI